MGKNLSRISQKGQRDGVEEKDFSKTTSQKENQPINQEKVFKEDIEKKDIEKKDTKKKEIEKKDTEKKDIEKKDIEKKEIEKEEINPQLLDEMYFQEEVDWFWDPLTKHSSIVIEDGRLIRTNGVGKNYIQGAVKGNFAIQRGERSSWALKVGKECGGRNMRLGVVGENFGLDWETQQYFGTVVLVDVRTHCPMYEARSQILGGDIVTFDVDRSCSPGFVMVSTERQGRIAVLTLSEKEEFFSPFICLSSTVQTVHLFNTRGKCLIKRARRGD